MGITKLMHMKESRPTRHTHLKNSIEYILNPSKTKDGILVGGNSGAIPEEVLRNFLETKQAFGKLEGRQGYHFVISFAKGETDEQTAYQTIKDFCEEYLGDGYDYVFAIHDDTDHVHGHIVFNSINREDGYKYRYQKGDWEKFIQPVTNRVCERHGLSRLTYEEEEPKGEPYRAWKDGMSNKKIARADIDFAIARSVDMESFFAELERLGYEITRKGTGAKGEYFSMRVPEEPGEKRSRAVRNTSLGGAYSMEAIRDRIRGQDIKKTYEDNMDWMQKQAGDYLKPMVSFKSKSQARLIEAANYYKLKNPYAVPAWRVREDMKNVKRLAAQCHYLREQGITSVSQAEEKLKSVEEQIRYLAVERRSLYATLDGMDEKGKAQGKRYQFLMRQLLREDIPDALWEQLADEKESLEEQLPKRFLEAEKGIRQKGNAIKALRKEAKLLRGILADEKKEQLHQSQEVKEPGL